MTREGNLREEKTIDADGFNPTLAIPNNPYPTTFLPTPEYGFPHNSNFHDNSAPLTNDYDNADYDENWRSSDAYYETDAQDEKFNLGWGEPTEDPGLNRLHEVSCTFSRRACQSRLIILVIIQLVRNDAVHKSKLSEMVLQAMQHLNGGPEAFQREYSNEVGQS